MRNSLSLQFILLPFGIALLLAGLFFDNGAAAHVLQSATPTPDRLAKPTLPASPNQADLGAQVYWLSCLPCHGDRGQGLTDEFRAAYPPEEQYCWERGCHGENPYESGFTLPKTIPAVIGPDALKKFTDAAQLKAYIRAAMPFWDPGSLTDDDAWKVTAFLLRQNGLWNASGELNESNAAQVIIPGAQPTPASAQEDVARETQFPVVPAVIVLAILVAAALILFPRRGKS